MTLRHTADFANKFQKMLDYRKERPIKTRKAIRKKYQQLYQILLTNEAKLISLSRNFVGYSEAETMALCFEPFFLHYRQCLKSLTPKQYQNNSNYSVFSSSYPIYRLKTGQGILLIEIGGLNPIFYFLATICSALLYSDSVVFYIKGYPKQFTDTLRQIGDLLFEEEEICCLDESEISLETLKKSSFNQVYSFTDTMSLKSDFLPKVGSENRFHFVVVDKKCQIAQVAREIFYANALNAGRSWYNPDMVFVHATVFNELKARLLNLARNPSKAHNISTMISSENFTRAEKCLEYFEKRDYRVLNPQACIDRNPITLHFPSVFIEKLELQEYAESFYKERLLNPILPLVRYENLNPLLEFLQNHPYRYKLSIFSGQSSVTNEIIHCSDGDLFYSNDIFAASIPRITSLPLPINYSENPVQVFANYKYVIVKRQNNLSGKLITPPLLTLQERYLQFNAMMRKIKQKL